MIALIEEQLAQQIRILREQANNDDQNAAYARANADQMAQAATEKRQQASALVEARALLYGAFGETPPSLDPPVYNPDPPIENPTDPPIENPTEPENTQPELDIPIDEDPAVGTEPTA